jgi:hypothetical protein
MRQLLTLVMMVMAAVVMMARCCKGRSREKQRKGEHKKFLHAAILSTASYPSNSTFRLGLSEVTVPSHFRWLHQGHRIEVDLHFQSTGCE